MDLDTWTTFQAINGSRRAVRDFDGTPLADADIRAIVAEALLAPSSGNLQPYRFHWVRDPAIKAALARACNGQRAAASAPTLLVVEASLTAARQTARSELAHVDETQSLDERSRRYHRDQLRKFKTFLRIAPLLLWSPFRILLSLFLPPLTLVPLGPAGARHWTARSAIYAAQTLLLAARARGLDTCPMEGFNPGRVARLLRLPRGSVIPLIIAVGRRAPSARLEPRWRRPLSDALVIHGAAPALPAPSPSVSAPASASAAAPTCAGPPSMASVPSNANVAELVDALVSGTSG